MDTPDQVRADADPSCRICDGEGWHHGWDVYMRPTQLRCPCVDRRRGDIAAIPVQPE